MVSDNLCMPSESATEPSLEIVAIDHVQLAMPADGEDEARRFYGDLLGLREVPKPPALAVRGGRWFVSADGHVHVHLGVEADFRPATKAHVAFVTRDLDAARRRLAERGATVTDDASLPGVDRWYIWDPFGNRIELVDEADRGFTVRED